MTNEGQQEKEERESGRERERGRKPLARFPQDVLPCSPKKVESELRMWAQVGNVQCEGSRPGTGGLPW